MIKKLYASKGEPIKQKPDNSYANKKDCKGGKNQILKRKMMERMKNMEKMKKMKMIEKKRDKKWFNIWSKHKWLLFDDIYNEILVDIII